MVARNCLSAYSLPVKILATPSKNQRLACEAILRGHRWLGGISEPVADRLLAAGRWYQVAPGETIAMAGEEDGGICGFASGTLSSRQMAATAEIPMTDLHMAPCWVIPRSFLPDEEWITTLCAQTPVTMVHVPRQAFAQLMEEFPELRLHLLRNVSAIFARMSLALSDALIRESGQRCIAVLLRIADRRLQGSEPSEVPVGHLDLAGMANLSRQKVGDVLRELEEQGLVELGYRRIRIPAPDRLRALLTD
jgi:CRP-like cAMP-binding protein